MSENPSAAHISFEVPVTEIELHNGLTSMAAMGVPIAAGKELEAYGQMGTLGVSFLSALRRNNCIYSGAFSWMASDWQLYLRSTSVDSNVQQSCKLITENDAVENVLVDVSYGTAGHFDALSSSLGLALERYGAVRGSSREESYAGIFRVGALAIHRIIDSVQFNGGRADRPVKLSWGNKATVYGAERAYEYTGAQLNKAKLESTPKGLRKLFTR